MRYLLWFGHRVMAYVQVTVEPLKLVRLIYVVVVAQHRHGQALAEASPRRRGRMKKNFFFHNHDAFLISDSKSKTICRHCIFKSQKLMNLWTEDFPLRILITTLVVSWPIQVVCILLLQPKGLTRSKRCEAGIE